MRDADAHAAPLETLRSNNEATMENTNARIYRDVLETLQECYDETGAAKHYPQKRLMENRASLNGWLAKLDRRPKKAATSGPRGIIFTLEVCQRILRDDSTNVSSLRERIASAIVHHRYDALGVDETMTHDADASSEEDNSNAASSKDESDDEDNDKGEDDGGVAGDEDEDEDEDEDIRRRRSPVHRSRSRSRSQSRSPGGDRRRDFSCERRNRRRSRNRPHGRQQQQQQPQQLPPSRLPCIAASIDAVMVAALTAIMSPSDLAAYHAARGVLTSGIGGDTDADKRATWATLCIMNQPPPPSNLIAMIKTACGVFIGDACSATEALDVDTAVLDQSVTTWGVDNERAKFALRIIRRCTMLPGESLAIVLSCRPEEVDDRLRHAHHLMFSWEMRSMLPDGTRRRPVPWIADACQVALRLLDERIVG